MICGSQVVFLCLYDKGENLKSGCKAFSRNVFFRHKAILKTPHY